MQEIDHIRSLQDLSFLLPPFSERRTVRMFCDFLRNLGVIFASSPHLQMDLQTFLEFGHCAHFSRVHSDFADAAIAVDGTVFSERYIARMTEKHSQFRLTFLSVTEESH